MNSRLYDIEDYYYRVLVRQPDISKKSLSGLTYRLAGILINSLDFDEARKLPQRKKLSEILHSSNQAILDSLAQLEDVGFIRRTTLDARIIHDENTTKEKQDFYTEKFKNELKARRFNDEFLLNYFYNITQREYVYYLFKSIIENDAKSVATYSYINKLPQNNNTIAIIKEIILQIYNSVSHIENIFMGMNNNEVIKIIQDLLNNSEIIPLTNNSNKPPYFAVYINNDNFKL